MEGERLVTPIVMMMAALMVLLIFTAARRSVATLWRATAAVCWVGLLLTLVTGSVPVYEYPCPLCGHGWNIEPAAYFAAVGVTTLLAHRTRGDHGRVRTGAVLSIVLSALILRAGVWEWLS